MASKHEKKYRVRRKCHRFREIVTMVRLGHLALQRGDSGPAIFLLSVAAASLAAARQKYGSSAKTSLLQRSVDRMGRRMAQAFTGGGAA